jgi:hypothetical protein
MIFDQLDETAFPITGIRNTPTSTPSENFYAAVRRYDYVDASNASSTILRDIWGPMVAEVNEATGSNFSSPLDAGAEYSGSFGTYQGESKAFFDFVTNWEKQNPGSISSNTMSLMSLESIDAAVISEAQRAVSEYDAISANSESFINGVANFLGTFSAGTKDPFNVVLMLGTMGVGTGINASKTLAGIALREALINGGGEVVKQPLVASWYKEIGLDYTAENFISNVGGAAVIGGALPIAGAGIKAGVGVTTRAVSRAIDMGTGVTRPTRALLDFLDASEPELNRTLSPSQMLAGVETLKSGGIKISRESQAAVTAAQDLLDLEASNPISGNPVGTIVDHASTMASAQHSLFNGEVPKIKAVPIEMVKPDAILQQADNLDGFVFRFNPNEIGVDAKTFQFKMGGDAFGVSERLRGVKVWDPILGGEILVYEYADGRMFVADGHQRLGLAKRIMSEDPAQNVVIYGRKLREADGVTPEQAMVVAAIKNIAEGSGSAIDAAKVARIDPAGFSSLIGKTLPPSSVLVRQANDMINLTDNAFGAIINEVIPANYGAIIGRVLSDRKDLQDAAVKILAKSEPANVFQAEAIVRQVREADAEQVQQFSLFGEETVTESLFTERAKILDQAYRQLKQDKATFANLTRNADRIEAEGGNVLDRQLNEQKATQDAQTIALLQTLANRKGPVSDALSAAARAFRDTGSYGRPTRDFLESVRNAIATGDLDRISSSDIGRTLDGPSPGSADTVGKEPVLDGFEEPNGVAAEQQIDQMTRDMFPEPVPRDQAAASEQPQFNPRSAIEEERVPIEEIRMPIDNTLPIDQILARVAALTEENIPLVRGLISRIDARFGTKSGDNVKDLAKVAQKANRPSILAKKPWHNVSHIRDSYRFKTVIDDIRDVPAIFDELLASGISLVKVDTGKLFSPKEWGWRIIAFDLRMPNGQLVEWYLPIRELEAQKKAEGHLLFEEWRNKTPEELNAQHDAYMGTIRKSFKGYDDAFQASLARIGISAEEAAASWARAESSMLEAARKSPSSSGMITSLGERGLETQAPSSVRSAEDPSAQNNMTRDVPSSISAKSTSGIAESLQSEPTQAGQQSLMLDEVSIMQRDLIDELQSTDTISVGLVQDANGNIVSQTMTMAEMKTMLDAEDEFIKQLGICGI